MKLEDGTSQFIKCGQQGHSSKCCKVDVSKFKDTYCLCCFGREPYIFCELAKDCKMLYRLRRLLVAGFINKSCVDNGENHNQFLHLMMSNSEQYLEKLSYLYKTFVLSSQKKPIHGVHSEFLRTEFQNNKVACQLNDSDSLAPLVPPSILLGVKGLNNISSSTARKEYKKQFSKTQSQRKYVFGALYRDIFKDCVRFIDVRDIGSLRMKINLSDGKETFVTVQNVSEHEWIHKEGIKLCSKSIKHASRVRHDTGDDGHMYCFGRKNVKEVYKSTSELAKNKQLSLEFAAFQKKMLGLLVKYENERLKNMLKSDRAQGIVPDEVLGGLDGVTARIIISENLINSSHFDLDASESISLFLEKYNDCADGWAFVLPNVMIDSDYKAVVIKLFHGCLIGWDGRKIRHCTATKSVGIGNKLFGLFYGSKDFGSES